VNNCSFYCHQASGVGLTSVTGSSTATIELEDLDQADLVFVIGGNPASNHPRLMRTLMQVRRRGGQVIVINPLVETGLVRFGVPSDLRSLLFGSEIARLYVQPHIGGDLAMLTGVAKRIVEMNAHDHAFLNNYCHGWADLQLSLKNASWDEIITKSGVTRSEINEIAERYAAADKVVFSWTMGITHHAHGVQNVQAIANLALLRGMVGRPGCGLLPIRGHSNVQGIGSMGVTPTLKNAIFTRLQDYFGVSLPTTPGRDTMSCMEGAAGGELKVGFCLGGNLYGSNPDAAYTSQALGKLDLLVYLNTTLNTGHAHGLAEETIVLPVLARDEEPQPTTQESMFNYVRFSDGGPRRHAGPRSEVEVIASLGEGVFESSTPIDWYTMRNTGQIRQAIAHIVPGHEKLIFIDRTKEEFHITGRAFHHPRFSTSDGKAHLHVHEFPELQGTDADEIRVMTIRSEGQFNTVVYEEEDTYRNIDRRDVILMHPEDLKRFNLTDGDRITVHGPAGSMPGIRATEFPAIKAGNAAMYYPEANRLIGRTLDPQSRTPAFKCVVVRIEMLVPSITAPSTTPHQN
jgi:molybdopterin-dependent oxidoreductase alpha subunit